MGITKQVFKVRESRKSVDFVDVRFLIDSGVVYSLVPRVILDGLHAEEYRELTFALADRATLKRKVGEAYFELNGEGAAAQVIFGEENEEPLLGATALKSMRLVLNSVTRTLHPTWMLVA
jgi:clan AA aspartic protease